MKHTIASILILASPIASAGTTAAPLDVAPPAETAPSPWFKRAALYAWTQSLEGDMAIAGTAFPVDVAFSDLVENLDMAFMGAFEIGRDRWSILLDLAYADISASVATPVGLVAPAARFEQKQFVGNLVGTYGIVRSDTVSFDLYAGARATWLEAELSVGATKLSADKGWIDPIIGMRFRAQLSPAFYFRAAGDIGGFDVESDLTWQAMAGFGWQFSRSGGAFLGYRALGTDYHDGGFTYDLVAHGPVLGMEFTF